MSVSREYVYGDDGHVDGGNNFFHWYCVCYCMVGMVDMQLL